jgi:hypothetical protein
MVLTRVMMLTLVMVLTYIMALAGLLDKRVIQVELINHLQSVMFGPIRFGIINTAGFTTVEYRIGA